jgi:hypothetical protein
MEGRTVVDATLARLEREAFFYRFDTYASDDQRAPNRLKRLFLAHPKSVQLYKTSPDVLMVDATFKTNCYNQPLLNFIGVTGSNQTIQLALCLLDSTVENDFVWALQQMKALLRLERINDPILIVSDRDRACLNAIQFVFNESNLRLCSWHMNKDVTAYTRQKLGQVLDQDRFQQGERVFVETEQGQSFLQKYEQAINAATEEEFDLHCCSLQTIWEDGYQYLQRTWFRDYRNLCCSFLTKNTFHFGISSTSRVEGNHAALKKWLGSSRNNVFTLVEKLLPWWEEFFVQNEQHRSQEESKVYIKYTQFFARSQRRIFRYAILKAHEQYAKSTAEVEMILRSQRSGEPEPQRTPCSNRFFQEYGIPCQHTIRDLRIVGETITPNEFHKHWWIHRDDEYIDRASPQIQEPFVRPQRRATRNQSSQRSKRTRTGVNGTRRDVMHHERVDRNYAAFNSFQTNSQPLPQLPVTNWTQPPSITIQQNFGSIHQAPTPSSFQTCIPSLGQTPPSSFKTQFVQNEQPAFFEPPYQATHFQRPFVQNEQQAYTPRRNYMRAGQTSFETPGPAYYCQ